MNNLLAGDGVWVNLGNVHMYMWPSDFLGFAAAALTTLAFVPQVIKIIRTKSAADISLLMYLIFGLGVFLWGIYGVMIYSVPVVVANAVTLALVCVVLFYKIRDFRKNP